MREVDAGVQKTDRHQIRPKAKSVRTTRAAQHNTAAPTSASVVKASSLHSGVGARRPAPCNRATLPSFDPSHPDSAASCRPIVRTPASGSACAERGRCTTRNGLASARGQPWRPHRRVSAHTRAQAERGWDQAEPTECASASASHRGSSSLRSSRSEFRAVCAGTGRGGQIRLLAASPALMTAHAMRSDAYSIALARSSRMMLMGSTRQGRRGPDGGMRRPARSLSRLGTRASPASASDS